MMTDKDINFDNILLDEKLYENVSVYDVSYKTSMSPKSFRIRFDKIDGFIKVRGGKFRHLVLCGYAFCDQISDNIDNLISEKGGITDSINHNFQKIRIDSYNSLPIEKIFTFHNVITLIKSVVNKN